MRKEMVLQIKNAEFEHETELFELYKKVAGITDGIIRNENEIDRNYIAGLLENSISNGLILVGVINNKIIGEIHSYTPNIYAFQHILTDLTILVDPKHQGKGIGRKLFVQFLETVKTDLNHILRIELYTREHNERNVKFYESLGFINEGRQKNKIFICDSVFETPLHMAWFNPNYKAESTEHNTT
jgi:ribosomal protein S18 acetylase RimI-like enzyme